MDLEPEFGNILEMGYGIVVSVGEHTGFHSDGICSESEFGNILEMVGKSCVPLQLMLRRGGCGLAFPFLLVRWFVEIVRDIGMPNVNSRGGMSTPKVLHGEL